MDTHVVLIPEKHLSTENTEKNEQKFKDIELPSLVC